MGWPPGWQLLAVNCLAAWRAQLSIADVQQSAIASKQAAIVAKLVETYVLVLSRCDPFHVRIDGKAHSSSR